MILLFIALLFIISFVLYCLQNYMVSLVLLIFTFLFTTCISSGFIASILIDKLQYPYANKLSSPQWQENDNIIILLGNGTTIINILPEVKIEPSIQSYSRIFETIRLYRLCKQKNKHCTIIVSGGNVQKHGLSESAIYSGKLLEAGIESKDIKLEDQSINTFQNAKLSSSIIKSMPGKLSEKNIILVSSAYHLKRSQLFFKYFGIDTIASRADYINVSYRLIPSAFNFYLTEIAIKEYLSIWFSNILY